MMADQSFSTVNCLSFPGIAWEDLLRRNYGWSLKLRMQRALIILPPKKKKQKNKTNKTKQKTKQTKQNKKKTNKKQKETKKRVYDENTWVKGQIRENKGF